MLLWQLRWGQLAISCELSGDTYFNLTETIVGVGVAISGPRRQTRGDRAHHANRQHTVQIGL